MTLNRIITYIAVSVSACLFAVLLLIALLYYGSPVERIPYKMAQRDDTLRIAYIGDSWAYIHHRNHQCLIPTFIGDQLQRPVKIYSYGLPGRTSKEIYEAMFEDEKLKQMLQRNGLDYCIVSAGINDANKKMSVKYYQDSADCIILFLLLNHIRPVILEIPDYDIYKIYRWERLNRKLLRKLSMLINNVPINCKQNYREALDELISKKAYRDKVSIIRYKSWNSNYEKDLKELYLVDGVHLNEHGNHVLDSVIAREIIKHIESYDHRN